MHTGKTVFAQLMSFVPAYEFHRCVNRYRGDYKVTSFSLESSRNSGVNIGSH